MGRLRRGGRDDTLFRSRAASLVLALQILSLGALDYSKWYIFVVVAAVVLAKISREGSYETW